MVAKWSCTSAADGSTGSGIPRGTSPTVATPRPDRSSRFDANNPPITSASAPGTLGANTCNATITTTLMIPTTSVVQSSSSMVLIHSPNCRQVFSPPATVPVSFGSSPTTTSMAAPNRKPVITALDKNCEIHPIRKAAATRNSSPVAIVMAATSSAVAVPDDNPAMTTAPAATAARAELGPVEICRDVPKIA